jgi:hypothetical protein
MQETAAGHGAVHGGWRWDWPRGRSGGVLALGLAAGIAGAALAVAESGRRPPVRAGRADRAGRYGQRPSGGGVPAYRGDMVRGSAPPGA